MSNSSISIVPKISAYPSRESKAREIRDWLVGLDIIEQTTTDCILGASEGYAVSNGARMVTPDPDYLPFDLVTNGLEITTERQVFHNWGNGLEALICPSCNLNLANEDLEFLNEWANCKSDNLICSLCKVEKDVHAFAFNPEWGFSDPGFTFWNWPSLTDWFIEEFREKLTYDINVVYAKV